MEQPKSNVNSSQEEGVQQGQSVKRRGRRYNRISYETRKELIKRVLKKGQKLTQVSTDLGIKLSTSKFILKSFKRFGRIFKKKSLQTKRRPQPPNVEDSSHHSQENREGTAVENIEPGYVFYPIFMYYPVLVASNSTLPSPPRQVIEGSFLNASSHTFFSL